MNNYNINICIKSELKDLQQFINDHWRENHILATNRNIMNWQHYNKENGKYNFILAKHLKSDAIHGVLGFIPVNHFDKAIKEKDLWMALWKVREDISAPGLGLSLLKYLMNYENPRSISVLGISPETIPLYKYLGFNTGVMNHYYIINNNIKKFNLIKNYKRLEQTYPVKETSIKMIRYEKSNFLSLCERSKFFTLNKMIPNKTPYYIYQRYFSHPIYNYCVYGLENNNDIVGIIVIRLTSYDSSNALRLVDFFGDAHELSGLFNPFQKLLQEFRAEYIDFYNIGIQKQLLLSNGFFQRNSDNGVIIPNYFEPFERKNVDIEYAYKCENGHHFNICKGDGDQDRPN